MDELNRDIFLLVFPACGCAGHYIRRAAAKFLGFRCCDCGLGVYGVLQPLAGVWADRFGAARLTLVGGGLLCVGSLLFPVADDTDKE